MADRRSSRWDQGPPRFVGSNGHSSVGSNYHVDLRKLAAMAAAGDSLDKGEWPLYVFLLTQRATQLSAQMLALPKMPSVMPSSSRGASAGEQMSHRSASHNGEINDGHSRDDRYQPVVTAAMRRRERHERSIEKRKQQFPDRPTHRRTDHNPHACELGCFYHEEDKTKHDHRSLRDRDGRPGPFRRGILRYPAPERKQQPVPVVALAAPAPASRRNISSATVPPLSPDWHGRPLSSALQDAVAKNLSIGEGINEHERDIEQIARNRILPRPRASSLPATASPPVLFAPGVPQSLERPNPFAAPTAQLFDFSAPRDGTGMPMAQLLPAFAIGTTCTQPATAPTFSHA